MKHYSFSAILSLAFIAACGGTIGGNPEKDGGGTQQPSTPGTPGTNTPTGENKPALRFDLTDAAVDDASHVYITIAEISVKAAAGDWIKLPLKQEAEVDLLSLQDGKVAELASIETLEAGSYSETRLILSDTVDSRLVDASGTEHALKIPSGSESGLKIKSEFTIGEDSAFHFTIDFDLRKSIKKNGAGKYMMKPVLRLVDNAVNGSISGGSAVADLVCIYKADVTPDSDDACDNAESSAQVKDAKFKQAFLAPGNYVLRFFKDGTPLDPDKPATVSAGQDTEI